ETQFAPFASQRSHWSVSVGNGLPIQMPVFTERFDPTAAGRPLIVGFVVFVGLLLRMTSLGAESTGPPLPTVFDALTRTRSRRPSGRRPAWASTSRYVDCVAPVMFAQFRPFASQRRHTYVKVIGVVPSHVPAVAVSSCPTVSVPVIVGGAVLLGAVAVTGPTA